MDETVASTVEEASAQAAEEPEAPAVAAEESGLVGDVEAESPAEPVTASSPETTRDTPREVVNLVESYPEPDSSLVDAWIRVPAGAREGANASAPAAWRDAGPSSPGAGSLPPMNGVSWQSPDSYDFDNGSTDEEPSSDLLTGEPDGQQGLAPAEEPEEEAPSRRSRRSQKKAAKKQARQDRADSKRAKKGKRGKKGQDVSEPETFVPSFGFASHPDYDLKWASMAHLATIPLLWFGLGFLAPFVVLAARGEQSQFVRDHAQASLNFQLSVLIYMLLTGFLGVFSPLLFVVPILVGIVAATAAWFSGQRAKNNQEAKYYLALPIF
jgi:hypothetical protein